MNIVTCIAPVNIAVIKYWGKRDEQLILPINDSISASLDTKQLCAKTSVMIGPDFPSDRIWLNGREESMSNPRLQNCLSQIKKRGQLSPAMENWHVHICSENNFPTEAGLASSAAGYACLAAALAKLFKIDGEISDIARSGSGSACRSIYGGFVRWHMGKDPKGSDSIARPIAPANHWPEMRVLILVVSDSKKKTPSAVGMKRSVETSELLRYRADKSVPERVEKMEKAIVEKNFVKFAELTMKDSNEMHAVCLDTYPPCAYLNDVSHSIINLVHAYNDAVNDIKVAYTNDAGPNTVLYLLDEDVPSVLGVLDYFFPPGSRENFEYIRGNPPGKIAPSEELVKRMGCDQQAAGRLKYIIHTRVGEGPSFIDDPKEHLLNLDGLPSRAL